MLETLNRMTCSVKLHTLAGANAAVFVWRTLSSSMRAMTVGIGAWHLHEGFIVLTTSEAQNATHLRWLYLALGEEHVVLGLLLLAVGLYSVTAALLSDLGSRSLMRRGAIWLQLWLLATHALSGLQATLLGRYADGTVIPRAHIWVDQSLYVFAALLLLATYITWERRGRRAAWT